MPSLETLTCSPAQGSLVSLPSVSLFKEGRRFASHSRWGSGGATDANFCRTYFGPRLPPPRLSSLSHWQLLRGDLEPPRSHAPHQRNCEMRKRGKGCLPGKRAGAQVWGRGPAAAPDCQPVVASSSSPGMLRRALGALLLHRVVSARLAVSGHARTAAPSPSSPGNDFQFTWRLSRLPRGRVA